MLFQKFFTIICVAFSILCRSVYADKLPQTHITLNAEKGCSVHVGAWLSPSCTHCAEYFASVLPKIASKPGFCVDFHSLPHLYPMDLPVSILIWSQGPEKSIINANLFYEKQSEWLMPSIDKSDIHDSKRKDDIDEFINSIKNKLSPETIAKISQYLSPTDPQLYVKIFALKNGFTIEHLKHFLPNGLADEALSRSLLKDLPRIMSVTSEMKAVNYSPAFTFVNSGSIIPDDQLDGKILTEASADDMLKKAGPPVPLKQKEQAQFSQKHTPKHIAQRSAESEIDDEDEEIQEAEDDIDEEDNDTDMDTMSDRLKEILDEQTTETESER